MRRWILPLLLLTVVVAVFAGAFVNAHDSYEYRIRFESVPDTDERLAGAIEKSGGVSNVLVVREEPTTLVITFTRDAMTYYRPIDPIYKSQQLGYGKALSHTLSKKSHWW